MGKNPICQAFDWVFLCFPIHSVHRGDGMSYRVEYGEKIKWEKAEEDWGMRRVIITGIFCMFFVLLVHLGVITKLQQSVYHLL